MIEDIWPLMKWGFILMTLLMTVLWILHFRLKNAGIVLAGWTGGLGLLGLVYIVMGDGFGPRRALIGLMVLLWSARLTWHFLSDRILNKPEDPRYTMLREKWGSRAGIKMFLYFEFQGILAALLSFPFVVLATDPYPEITGYEYAALLLWIAAWAGEAMADGQLKRFKSDPSNKGRTCQEGLWYHSRHPNYFFEWLIWVAYCIAALATPLGGFSILCPLVMYFMFKVCRIPATEAQAIRSRGEEYRDYQRTTSAFAPWVKRASDEPA